MAISEIVVTVYCNGGFHEPERLRFHDRALKSDIAKALRDRGWITRSDGSTFCSQHKARA